MDDKVTGREPQLGTNQDITGMEPMISRPRYDIKRFEDLVGHTLVSLINIDDEVLLFTLDNGQKYSLSHNQECCEYVRIVDIAGSLNELVGMPILLAEEVSNDNETPEGLDEPSESYTWTFYKLATNRGYATIRWLGESNGYYSEQVYWHEAF